MIDFNKRKGMETWVERLNESESKTMIGWAYEEDVPLLLEEIDRLKDEISRLRFKVAA